MGEDQNSNNQQQTDLPFSDMTRAVQITMVPYLYEKAYNEASGSEEEKRLEAKEELYTALRDTDSLYDAEVAIVNVDDTTAIILYEEDKHRATVTFDITQNMGDRYDNVVKCAPTEHALGGEVHGGFYEDLIEQQDDPNFPADNMVELIEGILHDSASKNDEKPLAVDFSGFCSGGAKSALAAGEMINNGLFDDPQNIQLENIYTFASVGYADKTSVGYTDKTFAENLEERVDQLGGKIWQVQRHGDNFSNLMTSKGPLLARPMDYEQAGTHVYLVPGKDSAEPQALINPTQEDIDNLPDAEVTGMDAHRPEPYERIIRKLDGATTAPENSYEDVCAVPDRSIQDNMLMGL